MAPLLASLPADIGHAINEDDGLWGFLAMGIALVALVIQLLPVVRTAARADVQNLDLLRQRVRRRRIELDLQSRLVLGSLLEIRLMRLAQSEVMSITDLYKRLRAGTQTYVLGGAGTGKTVLALALVGHSVERSEEDPDEPLMELISLRNWRVPAFRPSDREALTLWIASQLSKTYPSFSSRYFKQLLDSHRLIPCLDGLDEVTNDHRDSLSKALGSYLEAELPVVIFSRDRGVPSLQQPTQEGEPSPRFDVLELMPIDRERLESLPEYEQLARRIGRSTQPHRLQEMLSNPLQLSIATSVWSEDSENEIGPDEDPEDSLWISFFDRALGDGELRRSAGWVALYAEQKFYDHFRVRDLYSTAVATWWTLLVVSALLVAGSIDSAAGGYNLLVLLAIGLGLAQPEHSWPLGLASRISHRPRYNSKAVSRLATVFVALAVPVLLFVGNFVNYFVVDVLFEHVSLALWWEWDPKAAVDTITREPWVPIVLMISIPVFREVDLTRPVRPVRLPRWAIPAASVAITGFGIAVQNPGAMLPGLALLSPWIYLGSANVALQIRRQAPFWGFKRTCHSLVKTGVLNANASHYRFRHAVISERLAREAVKVLAGQGKLDQLAWPRRASFLIDSWDQFRNVREVSHLLDGLIAACPDDELVVTNWALYQYYGLQKPESALSRLSDFSREFPHSYVRVHVAEILDVEGRFSEAEEIWPGVAAEHAWVMHKWVRRQVVFAGRATEMIALLRERITEAVAKGSSEQTFARLILAELECRFGDTSEAKRGFRTLTRVAEGSDPYQSQRAVLELARVHAEDEGDFDTAWGLLDDIPEGSLKFARCSQLRAAAGETESAAQYGQEAYALAGWLDDPVEQMEAILTAACTSPQVAPEASRRLATMVGFGWRLPGRDFDSLAGLSNQAAELVAEACAPPVMAHTEAAASAG